MTQCFIELKRQFYTISEKSSGVGDFESVINYGSSHPLLWSDILKQPRSVIIAEAGAGKTEEMKQQTIKLRKEDLQAFFLRLENLKDNFEYGFEGEKGMLGDFDEFNKWHRGTEEAWFFLDSVDEAKLRNPKDFALALFNFNKALASRLEGARIIVTSRLTWDPHSDLDLFKKWLPYRIINSKESIHEDDTSSNSSTETSKVVDYFKEHQSNTKPTEPKVYCLAKLDNTRIKQFAEARSIENVDVFMEALKRSNAQDFAARPKDLDDLLSFWNKTSTIGSVFELAKHSVDTKIIEADSNRKKARYLPKEKALIGLKRIAAVTSLAKLYTVAISDNCKNCNSISIQDMLPNWSPQDQEALLELRIFDPAVYGAVRFLHRSVREYLAAQWFLDRLKDGEIRLVTQLFFREQYGIKCIAPLLQPVLPWIAIFNESFRQKALEISPKILLQGGDSTQFPFDTRKQILLNICKKLAMSELNREPFDLVTIQRFAKTDMEETVSGLLKKYSGKSEIQSLLLRMVWHGKYISCSKIAQTIVLNESEKKYTRIDAIRALQATAVDADLNELVNDFVSRAEIIDCQVAAELINSFAPDWVDMSQLCLIFEKIEQTIDKFELRHSLQELVERLEIVDLENLLKSLKILIKRKPHIEQPKDNISQEYQWLVGTCLWVFRALIQYRSEYLFTEDSLSLLTELAIYRIYHGGEYNGVPTTDIEKRISDWPKLNNTLFWYDVNNKRKKSKKPIADYLDIQSFEAFWSLSCISFDDAINWIKSRELIDDKLVALSIAFVKCTSGGIQCKQQEELKQLVKILPKLKEDFHERLKVDRKGEEVIKRIKRHNSEAIQSQKKLEEQRKKEQEDWKEYIASHLDEIRNISICFKDKVYKSQYHLFERMKSLGKDNQKWTQVNWQVLKSDQSEEVANIFRQFLITCGKQYTPKLRSEGIDNPHSVPYPVIFGLSGLEIDFLESKDWDSSISMKVATNIVRYAFKELNGVPSWLETFYSKFPELVESHFMQEIKWELTEYKDETPINYALSKLTHYCKWLHKSLAKTLFEALENYEISDIGHLKDILKIIFVSEQVTSEELSTLASRKVKKTSEVHLVAIWSAVAVSVNPDDAIDILGQELSGMDNPDNAVKFAMHFVVSLIGSRSQYSLSSRDTFKSPQNLCKLYLLLHQYIKVDEDNNRVGTGVYSPELRDDAQEARESILNLLTEIPGKDTFVALQKIVNEHPHERCRLWVSKLLTKHAEAEADIPEWSAEDVISFEEKTGKEPRCAKELFELGINRLCNLKHSLEDGEYSVAATWKKEESETALRILIAAWLHERRRCMYTVHQEEEQADKKRTDLKLYTTSEDAPPVPIELKIANNWSGPNLFERLKNQLCNDYLRDPQTKYGIYLLCYRGQKKRWQHPQTSESMSFNQLIDALQAYVNEFIKVNSKIEKVEVIGIDLTKRGIENRNH